MKFVIWGAGERGGRIAYHIKAENIVAFLDMDTNKVGTLCDGIEVIDFNMYLEKYSDVCIVVSTHEEEVVPFLESQGIRNYFTMTNCPEDFQSSNMRMTLKEEIQKYIDKDKRYVIYGNSLYSVLLYSWLKELDMMYLPYLIMGNDCDESILQELQSQYGIYVLKDFNELTESTDKVLVTIDEQDVDWKKLIPENMLDKAESVLYFSENISRYHNKEIEKYKGIHKGKRCFIVATGPSLTSEDLGVLKANNEICISMNTVYKKFESTDWRPNYYITTDYRMMKHYKEAIDYMKDSQCFIADSYEPFCQQKHDSNIMIYHLGRIFRHNGYIPFSEDISKIVYNTATVTYAAMQLAVYLGCTEIYLLGTDATGINDGYSTYGHFYKEKKQESICFGRQVLVSYNSAKKYADEHNIGIYNATRGGELEVFTRKNFDELFV